MTHEHHDRDVVVERDSGPGVGTIIGIILAVVIVLALIWFLGFGGFEGNQGGTDININTPVEPAPGGGEGGGGGDPVQP
ncbi:MAG TPA: hypothetical protein VNT28_09780 [Candidatus Limnocylindrales bacterium]|jgi:hypothetical protein|nr:hypothetical protein [Candidatus Limnocylindrales bacterium]